MYDDAWVCGNTNNCQLGTFTNGVLIRAFESSQLNGKDPERYTRGDVMNMRLSRQFMITPTFPACCRQTGVRKRRGFPEAKPFL